MQSLHRTAGPSLGFALIVFLVGCAVKPGLREPPTPSYSDREAVELLRSGKPAAAAREFLRLAGLAPPPEQYAYALRAVEAHIEANDPAAAGSVLRGLRIPKEELFLSAWQGVLLARLNLERDPKALLGRLERVDRSAVPSEFRARYHEYRAAAYLRVGDYLKAAREHVALDPLIGDEARRAANALATWEALNRLEMAYLSQHLPADAGALRGWMELAILARTPAHAPFEARVRDWAFRYPGHPAARDVLPRLTEQRAVLDFEPQHVALLLPLTGEYGAPSAAIRDGFLAAWYQDPGHSRRRVLTVYDANAANALAVYRRALEEGVDFVVGPLDKPAIAALVKDKAITVPTLALNEVATPVGRGPGAAAPSEELLFQFGLLPEDEARQVAERAWLDGRVHARVIAPETPWGERVARAFEAYWQELGGEVVARVGYRRNGPDLRSAIGRLLGGAALRYARPGPSEAFGVAQATAAPLAEFIFVAANPRDARLVLPLIGYHGTDPLPVYSTSNAYSGAVSRESDRDLEGLVFPDMPWALERERDPLRYQVEQHWPRSFGALVRFYAFGADACALISHLGRLSRDPLARLEGATGLLHIDPEGRVRRQLTWAQFHGGVPQVLDR